MGGYGYLILLFMFVLKGRVKCELNSSGGKVLRISPSREFPEKSIETIGGRTSDPLARNKSYLLPVTPYACVYHPQLCPGLCPASFTHLLCLIGPQSGVCIDQGGPGLSLLNNRIKNDNPKIRRHQRSPATATDCRPN